MKTVLETDRLVLRHVIPNDDEFLFAFQLAPVGGRNTERLGRLALGELGVLAKLPELITLHLHRSALKLAPGTSARYSGSEGRSP